MYSTCITIHNNYCINVSTLSLVYKLYYHQVGAKYIAFLIFGSICSSSVFGIESVHAIVHVSKINTFKI